MRDKQVEPMCSGAYVGCIVRSLAGRDAKRIFAVVAVEEESGETGGYVWLADGRLRRLAQPKRKKLRHLRILCPQDRELAQMITDNSLRDAVLYARLMQFEQIDNANADANA